MRALLIMQKSFYSFTEIIADELNRKGYDVTIANDEYPSNNFGKIIGKLRFHLLLSFWTYRVFDKRILVGRKFDLVFIIKGRGMSPRLVTRLRKDGTRVVAFNWDSFSYNPSPIVWYKYVSKYCTFDYADSEKYKISQVDLFSALPSVENSKKRKYSISVIQRSHSGRIKFINNILGIIGTTNCYIHIYESNVFSFILNALSNPVLYFKYKKYIHFKSLKYRDYAEIMRESDFTVDYATPKQTGITMRCFEALASGTKIITNNQYCFKNPNFNELNTIVFHGSDSGESILKKFKALQGVRPEPRRRTVSEFMLDVLSEVDPR